MSFSTYTFFLLTQIKMQHFLSCLMQFSYTEIDNFPDDFIPLNEVRNFDTLIFATFMAIFMFYCDVGDVCYRI